MDKLMKANLDKQITLPINEVADYIKDKIKY